MSNPTNLTSLTTVLLLASLTLPWPRAAQAQTSAPTARPRVGVAFGGGSARGLAHVGIIRWFEEHHIPIDVAAGTSMGGLIGGAFATGMNANEIEAMLAAVDWDAMFGTSNFEFQNVRRKRDRRAYPSHLEFGLKGGIVPPPSLNSGQQVEFLLARVTAPYYDLGSFDDLPTPFRVVAVDLRTARAVVLDRGSLAQAMRATMSLPLIFPPVEIDEQVLVDGGAMNNVPADVARAMGADRVVAVNVGDLKDKDEISYTMLGLAGETLDAMMRANTLRALASADVIIDVPLKEYGSLDWRRYRELIAEGYRAADAMKDQLLPLAVDEAAWQAWLTARVATRRTALPTPAFVSVEGAGRADASMMENTLADHIGRPLDIDELEADLTHLGGLDRYQTLDWRIAQTEEGVGLGVRAQPKKYGPPFVLLGFSLENTTSNDFRFGLAGRYLAFDVLGSGTELRIDAAVGSDPSLVAALYRPLGRTALFLEPYAGVGTRTLSNVEKGKIASAYRQTRSVLGLDAGLNLGRLDEVRVGVRYGRLDASIRVGDPGLPELGGEEAVVDLRWTHDGQDSPVVPSKGVHARATLQHFLTAPELPDAAAGDRSSRNVTQAEVNLSSFWSLGATEHGRLFVIGGGGTSFRGRPLPTEQYELGGPFRLGAFNRGEQRGDHYVLATGGYLHEVTRLPDFLGGSVYLGGWLDSGAAFDQWDDANYAVHLSSGVAADTLFGPAFLSASLGFDGNWRVYFGIGRLLR